MKAYTDIEQSKKLAELLPPETADMEYIILTEDGSFVSDVPFVKDDSEEEDSAYGQVFNRINCWSLDALLEAMPEYIRKYDDDRVYRNYRLNLYRSYYHCCSYTFGSSTKDNDNNTLYCIGEENWVDACYKMILKLQEQKLL